MDKYERLEKMTRYLSVGIGVIAGSFVYDFAQDKLAPGHSVSFSNLLPIPILLITVGLVAGVVEYVIEFAFDSLRFVRPFLIGRMFIEGTWIEVIKYKSAMIGISEVFLGSSGYNVTFAGRSKRKSVSTHAEVQGAAAELAFGHFHAEMLQIKWPILRYKYTQNPADTTARAAKQDGYGELLFFERNRGAPLRFHSFFIHLSTGTRYDVEAIKVTDPSDLRKLDDPNLRDETVAAIAKLLESEPTPPAE